MTIKNGGFYGSRNAFIETVGSSNMEAMENENGESPQEEDFINENSNDSRPGFLSALGLHPAGQNGASLRQTPEKRSALLYNKRGTVSLCISSSSIDDFLKLCSINQTQEELYGCINLGI